MAVQRVQALVERDDELAAIDDFFAVAGGGDGSVLMIEAAAGVGKTALLAIARDRGAAYGLEVATARGGELERDFPFGVVRQLLEPLVGRASKTERRAFFEGAARLAAALVSAPDQAADLSPLSVGSFGRPAGAAMHGLYWLVANLAERGPLLLCVDDAHWGDEASLRWLLYLARRLEGLPVALLLAARPGEPGTDAELLGGLQAEPLTRVVRLEPLSPDGSDAFVRQALGTSADAEFSAACHVLTGGNPFLLAALTGVLARDGVTPTAASESRLRELVPDTVARSLVLRMARLPEATGALARAVAVMGPGVTLHDCCALTGLEDREAAQAADALAAVAILGPGLPLEFVHPLVRDAVYGDVPAAERAVWHARAARVLAAGGARSERVAAQLLRAHPAGDPWVVARLRAAAADAMARADPLTAVAFLGRACAEPVPATERLAVLQELWEAGFFAGEGVTGDELGIDRIEELKADARALQISGFYVAMLLWRVGRGDEADAVLERTQAAASAAGDRDRELHTEVRRITMAQLSPAEALRRLEPHRSQVDPDSYAGRLVDASLAWYGGVTGLAAADVAELGRRAFSDGRLVSELLDDNAILSTYVLGLLRTDELELCEDAIERILQEGQARGSASIAGGGAYLSAYLAHLRGDLVRAEAHIAAAVAAFEQLGILAKVPPMTALYVEVLTDRGMLEDAATELAVAGMEGDIPDHWWFGPVLWSRAHLRLTRGHTRTGVRDLLELGRRFDREKVVSPVAEPWVPYAAPFLAQLGEHGTARRLAERGMQEARAWGTRRALGQALRSAGLVAGGPEGIELLAKSVSMLEASPARLQYARALIELGAALRRANQRSQARGPLREGLDLAHRCGARLLAARAEEELRATGAKPRRLVLTGVDALTGSERRIAEMAAEGRTNREIAQALFVTNRTVETHLTHAYAKLDVQGRDQLAGILA
jgi:DNA-binding CsgD family transcriptional regulator